MNSFGTFFQHGQRVYCSTASYTQDLQESSKIIPKGTLETTKQNTQIMRIYIQLNQHRSQNGPKQPSQILQNYQKINPKLTQNRSKIDQKSTPAAFLEPLGAKGTKFSVPREALLPKVPPNGTHKLLQNCPTSASTPLPGPLRSNLNNTWKLVARNCQ